MGNSWPHKGNGVRAGNNMARHSFAIKYPCHLQTHHHLQLQGGEEEQPGSLRVPEQALGTAHPVAATSRGKAQREFSQTKGPCSSVVTLSRNSREAEWHRDNSKSQLLGCETKGIRVSCLTLPALGWDTMSPALQTQSCSGHREAMAEVKICIIHRNCC